MLSDIPLNVFEKNKDWYIWEGENKIQETWSKRVFMVFYTRHASNIEGPKYIYYFKYALIIYKLCVLDANNLWGGSGATD